MPHLSIGALGPLVVTLDGQTVTDQAYDKAWALLVYVAHAREYAHRREKLAGLLWPDKPEENARTNLRQALARLRKALDSGAEARSITSVTPAHLLTNRSDVQFNVACAYTLDVAEFTALLRACATHEHRQAESCPVCAERREQAVVLYRGPFLGAFHIDDSDLFEEWVTLVREPLHQQALDALAALVVYHERHGNYAKALHYGERQLELDPWREEAYRQIMRLLALNGQRTAALQCYERCRTILELELDVTPAAETIALYEQIRAAERYGAVKTDYLALPTMRHQNLPLQPTPFLGREQELAELADLLADPQCRLITLLGVGGIGKTRLALQAASEASEMFADGAVFVNLAPLDAAEFIVPAVAAALDFTLPNRTAPRTELLRYLRQKELLLVLDNFEHLVDQSAVGEGGATDLLTAILQKTAGVKLLVTTRERLNVQGEWVFDVHGLETHAGAYRVGAGRTADFERISAVALFLQTARRVQKGFMPTPADRVAIVHICQLVQGMPLALELAAAWVRVLSCPEIAHEIAQSLGFLTTTLRDLPARHRSLQAVFDHSWQLLTREEQRVFAGCSVFRGGFTREAASDVAGASLSSLAALVDKALLQRNLDGRYEVHELARQYAAVRLNDAQQMIQTRHRHLEFFMHFAEEAQSRIHIGQQAAQWHEWVENDHDNLRAAVDWSLSNGELPPGMRIVAALMEFWMNRGYAPEGQSQAERFLARAEAVTYPNLRGMVLHTGGVCALYHGRDSIARAWLEEAAVIGRELGDSGKDILAMALIGLEYTLSDTQALDTLQALSEEALMLSEDIRVGWVKSHALNQLGVLAWRRGDYAGAHRRFLESLECFQADGNNYERALVIRRLGIMRYEQGDYAAANAYLRQSLSIFEEVGDKVRMSGTLTWLGHLAMAQGNEREAEDFQSKALLLIRQTGHLIERVDPLNALGRLAQRQGDYARARIFHQESLDLCIQMEDSALLAHTVEAFACLAARQGEAEEAARLFGAVEVSRVPTKLQINATWRAEHDQWVARVRTQLGEESFAAAWAVGTAMSLLEAVAFIEKQR